MTVIGPPQSDCRLVPVRGAMPQATSPMSPTRQGAHLGPPRQGQCQPPPIRVARHCGTRIPRPGGRNRDPGSTQWRGAFPRRIVPDPNVWPRHLRASTGLSTDQQVRPRTCPRDIHSRSTRIQTPRLGKRSWLESPGSADDPVSAHPRERPVERRDRGNEDLRSPTPTLPPGGGLQAPPGAPERNNAGAAGALGRARN